MILRQISVFNVCLANQGLASSADFRTIDFRTVTWILYASVRGIEFLG